MILQGPFRGPAAVHLDPAPDWPPLCLGRLDHFRKDFIYVGVFFFVVVVIVSFVGFQSAFPLTAEVTWLFKFGSTANQSQPFAEQLVGFALGTSLETHPLFDGVLILLIVYAGCAEQL